MFKAIGKKLANAWQGAKAGLVAVDQAISETYAKHKRTQALEEAMRGAVKEQTPAPSIYKNRAARRAWDRERITRATKFHSKRNGMRYNKSETHLTVNDRGFQFVFNTLLNKLISRFVPRVEGAFA